MLHIIKRTLIIVSVILSFSFLFLGPSYGQNDRNLYSSSYVNSRPETTQKVDTYYDDESRETSKISSIWNPDLGIWEVLGKIEYTYNDNSKIQAVITYVWASNTRTFVESEKTDYQYNQIEGSTTETRSYWDPNLRMWVYNSPLP